MSVTRYLTPLRRINGLMLAHKVSLVGYQELLLQTDPDAGLSNTIVAIGQGPEPGIAPRFDGHLQFVEPQQLG